MSANSNPPIENLATARSLPRVLRPQPLRAVVQGLLRRLRSGTLHVELPDGERLHARGAASGPEATLRLHRWRPLWRLLTQGDIGLAASYRDGDWSSPDGTALLLLGSANDEAWQSTLREAAPWRTASRLLHRARANTRRGSRHNIAFHYDLGNAFYARWLDDAMQYSSALYETGRESLEQAQAAKLQRILALVDAPDGARVLEIGCGWGRLGALLARKPATRVTGLTLSKEQLAHARHEAERLGVADRMDLRLQDYRDVDGRYDRIVSIEMLEAVGEDYWPAYFDVLRERLAPGGHAIVQVITIGEPWFERYRSGADFIQRFIFPGGMLPTRTALDTHAQAAGLRFAECLRFGASYAATLAEWRRRFLAAWPAIEPLGFDDRFRRLWEYYLCYCEAGFRSGRIDVGLYRLERA
jgi:cyclopropane-fatty-acyl-phospholipid synthase